MHTDSTLHATLAEVKSASYSLALAGARARNEALQAIVGMLKEHKDLIFQANAKDIAHAKQEGLRQALIDRLVLDSKGLDSMIQALYEIIAQEEVIGSVVGGGMRPSGIMITQVRVPLGVVAMIYESRPNVTIDAAALCIKSGNAVVLKGGKEAKHTNAALAMCIERALESSGLPRQCVCMLDIVRSDLVALLQASQYIDVVIPRGGQGLIHFVLEHSKIPVIFHDKGVCHAFIDKSASASMAIDICINAKVSRPSACNAIETILVHAQCPNDVLESLAGALIEQGVSIRAECRAHARLARFHDADALEHAKAQDFGAEFGALVVALKIVDSLEEAIRHIRTHGSGHSEIIITQDIERAQEFCAQVDAAGVFVNASSRFNDGGEFGLGAEIGISTQKLHARGPMGAVHLTTTKYIVEGRGAIRQ